MITKSSTVTIYMCNAISRLTVVYHTKLTCSLGAIFSYIYIYIKIWVSYCVFKSHFRENIVLWFLDDHSPLQGNAKPAVVSLPNNTYLFCHLNETGSKLFMFHIFMHTHHKCIQRSSGQEQGDEISVQYIWFSGQICPLIKLFSLTWIVTLLLFIKPFLELSVLNGERLLFIHVEEMIVFLN